MNERRHARTHGVGARRAAPHHTAPRRKEADAEASRTAAVHGRAPFAPSFPPSLISARSFAHAVHEEKATSPTTELRSYLYPYKRVCQRHAEPPRRRPRSISSTAATDDGLGRRGGRKLVNLRLGGGHGRTDERGGGRDGAARHDAYQPLQRTARPPTAK